MKSSGKGLKLDTIMLREVTWTQKSIACMLSLMSEGCFESLEVSVSFGRQVRKLVRGHDRGWEISRGRKIECSDLKEKANGRGNVKWGGAGRAGWWRKNN